MTTIKGYSDNLPDKLNEIYRNQMLEKLDPELKKQLANAKGDIIFNYAKGTFVVTGVNDDLEKAIIADLKSKR